MREPTYNLSINDVLCARAALSAALHHRYADARTELSHLDFPAMAEVHVGLLALAALIEARLRARVASVSRIPAAEPDEAIGTAVFDVAPISPPAPFVRCGYTHPVYGRCTQANRHPVVDISLADYGHRYEVDAMAEAVVERAVAAYEPSVTTDLRPPSYVNRED